MRRKMVLVGLLALSFVKAQPVQPVPPVTKSELLRKLEIPEANQGIGVDRDFFYAVDNRKIGKYDKKTGRQVALFEDAKNGAMLHLDSAVVEGGKLYAAHSNYPQLPMTSSIEIFDTASMQHIGTHSFGIEWGSLTWLDRHNGFWWAGFANYNKVFGPSQQPYGNKYWTTVVKLNDQFQKLEAWTLPEPVLERFEEMSNSGGSWGPDGKLYLSGHDPAEVYVMELPKIGSVLQWVGTVTVEIKGQGIAWDRSEPGVLYGIIRGSKTQPHQVTVSRLNVK